jgi:chemotaxis protein MotB
LKTVASIIKDTPFLVGIAAHSDVRSSRKEDPRSPWETTALRAGLIMRYLVDQGGLPLKRMAAAGFGPYRPAVPGGESRETAPNERVEFFFELPAAT